MKRPPGNDIDLAIINAGKRQMLRFLREQRAKGLLICGVPGSGKSKLLEHMIRQDICLWHTHHCGGLLIDSQGSLYDDIVEHMAACRLDRVPVIPIDLRRNDYIISYDLLRRRMGGDPAVHIRAMIQAMLHAWGQSGTQDTPRLATWMEGILFPLYEKERPLIDALQIISDPAVRAELTRNVEHLVAQATWKTARHLKEERFQELVESTANKLRKFLSTKLIQSMLSQKGESLDMLKAIEDGAFVLVSLATAKSLIASEDAKTIGNLILSEAWQAVQTRGATRDVKPFYVYVDEAQSYVNPSMIETLDQARKFGLHFTFGMQFPSQFKRNGNVGQMIFDSLMGNCRSKICFQLSHPEDVETLALWIARQAIDPDQIKDEIYSPKVFAQKVIHLPSYSKGETDSVGGGEQFSITETENHSVSDTWSHTDTNSISLTNTVGLTQGHSTAHSTNVGATHSNSQTRSSHEDFSTGQSLGDGTGYGLNTSHALTSSDSLSDNWSKGVTQTTGRSLQRGQNRAISQTFGRPSEEFREELDGYLAGSLDEDQLEEFNKKRGRQVTVSAGRNEGSTDSTSLATSSTAGGSRTRGRAQMASQGLSLSRQQMRTLSNSKTSGNAFAHGTSDAFTESTSLANASNLALSHGQGMTQGFSSADSYGGSETFGTSLARTYGQSRTWGRAKSVTISHVPVVWQDLRWDVSSRTFRSVDEQIFLWGKYLDGQPDRHCLARLAGMPMPIPLVTATVKRVPVTDRWVQRWVTEKMAKLTFALAASDSARRLADHNQKLLESVHEPNRQREAVTTRRMLKKI